MRSGWLFCELSRQLRIILSQVTDDNIIWYVWVLHAIQTVDRRLNRIHTVTTSSHTTYMTYSTWSIKKWSTYWFHTHFVIIDLMNVFRLLSIAVHKNWPVKQTSTSKFKSLRCQSAETFCRLNVQLLRYRYENISLTYHSSKSSKPYRLQLQQCRSSLQTVWWSTKLQLTVKTYCKSDSSSDFRPFETLFTN